MKNLNKTNLNKLRIEHNRVVKKEYRVNPANQFRFDEWFICKCHELWTAEIPSYQTKSGNPYILEVA